MNITPDDKKYKYFEMVGLLLTRLLMIMSILQQLGVLKSILDRMSTTGKEFPLQKLLTLFEVIWELTDNFWSVILGDRLTYHLFTNYSWGGFTLAIFFWSISMFISESDNLLINSTHQLKKGRLMIIVYMIFFIITIIYGLDKDEWIPYVQEPTWEINLVHKQQISAGTFLIVYYFIFVTSYFTNQKSNSGSIRFLENPKIMTYTFLGMSLENYASFEGFPGFIDPTNRFIKGYEEIFQQEQTWTSTDKLFHFTMSSIAVLILLMYLPEPRNAILSSIAAVIFWEIFEISLNPREASDSLLDMLINSSAIITTALIFKRWENNKMLTLDIN